MKKKTEVTLDVFEDTYIPEELVNRDAQRSQLHRTVNMFRNGVTRTTFVSGPTATGKTVTARKVIEEEFDRTVYINCWTVQTRHQILVKIARTCNGFVDVFESGTATSVAYRKVETSDKPVIVILDEADKLREEEVVYDLIELPHIQPVIISNKTTEQAFNDERIRSRMSGAMRIQFDEYSTEKISQILQQRLEAANVAQYSTELLDEMAEKTVNLRQALQNLQEAVFDIAKGEDSDTALSERIDESADDAEVVRKDKLFESIKESQVEHIRALLDSLESEPIPARELYKRYERRVDNSQIRRTLRKYLTLLSDHDLIESSGEGRWTEYKLKQDVPKKLEEVSA